MKREDNMSKTESLAKEIRGQEWLTSIIASAKDHHDLEATLLSINDSIPVNRLKIGKKGAARDIIFVGAVCQLYCVTLVGV